MSVSLNEKGKIVFQNSGVTNSNSASIVAPSSMAASLSYTIPDAGSSCNFMLGRRNVIALSNAAAAVARDLTAAESGSLVTIDASTAGKAFAVTLPALAAGLCYDFAVIAKNSALIDAVVTPKDAGKVNAVLTQGAATASASAKNTFTFVKDVATVGTTARAICDGVSWNVSVVSPTDLAVTAP